MRNRGMTVVSVLLLVVGCFCMVLGFLFWSGELNVFRPDIPEKEPYCVVEFQEAVRLGDTYEGAQAYEGYSFYELHYSVENMGELEFYRGLPSIYYMGKEYGSVYDYWENQNTEEEEELFSDAYDARIPPGRTGKATQVIQIREGEESLTGSYYPSYSDEELFVEIQIR